MVTCNIVDASKIISTKKFVPFSSETKKLVVGVMTNFRRETGSQEELRSIYAVV